MVYPTYHHLDLDPGWFVGLESGLGYDPEVQKSVSQSLNGAMGAFNLLGTATAGLAVLISLIMVCLGERNGYEFWFIVSGIDERPDCFDRPLPR